MKKYKTILLEVSINVFNKLLKEFKSNYIDEKPKTFRVRQQSPSKFSFFKTITLPGDSRVKAVIGKLKDSPKKGTQIQSLIFFKKFFPTKKDVLKWLSKYK